MILLYVAGKRDVDSGLQQRHQGGVPGNQRQLQFWRWHHHVGEGHVVNGGYFCPSVMPEVCCARASGCPLRDKASDVVFDGYIAAGC